MKIFQLRRMTHTKQAGISMIEMLVTLVIISIGLLGIAALQSRGQLATQGAYIVTQAVTQGANIMDKMRANRICARDDLLSTSPNAGICGGVGYATTPSAADCVANACSPAQLRDFDLNQWNAELARTLPNGSGTIAIPNPPANGDTNVTYLITITWTLKDVEQDEGGSTVRQQQWSLVL